jgi:Helix-turn-helix domain
VLCGDGNPVQEVPSVAVGLYLFRDALLDADLPASTKLVLFVLASYASTGSGENARPGMKRLVRQCQLGERAIDGHLRRAVRAGYLTKTSSGYCGSAACYQLTVPADRVTRSGGEGRLRLVGKPEAECRLPSTGSRSSRVGKAGTCMPAKPGENRKIRAGKAGTQVPPNSLQENSSTR